MNPVLASGRQPHQAGPVAQQRPQIPGGLGGDPGFGQQVGPQQLARVAASTLSFFNRAEAMALQRLGWTKCGSSSSSSSKSTSQLQP
jgi:hypothetical protein